MKLNSMTSFFLSLFSLSFLKLTCDYFVFLHMFVSSNFQWERCYLSENFTFSFFFRLIIRLSADSTDGLFIIVHNVFFCVMMMESQTRVLDLFWYFAHRLSALAKHPVHSLARVVEKWLLMQLYNITEMKEKPVSTAWDCCCCCRCCTLHCIVLFQYPAYISIAHFAKLIFFVHLKINDARNKFAWTIESFSSWTNGYDN